MTSADDFNFAQPDGTCDTEKQSSMVRRTIASRKMPAGLALAGLHGCVSRLKYAA